MKQNTINKEYAYQVLNENYADYKCNGDPDDTTTLRQYVELEAESDPHFFTWLYNSEQGIESEDELTDEQKEEYKDFLKNWCE